MNDETINIIKNNKHIYYFLKEESHYYKDLYRDPNFIKKLDKLAREKYKIRPIDRLEKLENTISMIATLLDVLKE